MGEGGVGVREGDLGDGGAGRVVSDQVRRLLTSSCNTSVQLHAL